MPARKIHYNRLFDDFSYDTSTDGTTAFTDGETQTVFHCDGLDQGDNHFDVVARHSISTPSGSSQLPVTSVVRK